MAQIDIQSLVGGRYIFFKSLQNSTKPEYKQLYTLASKRVSNIESVLSNSQKADKNSKEFIKFQIFMSQYLEKLQSIAQKMRAAELSYINHALKDFDNGDIFTDKAKRALQELQGGKINENNYQGLIEILNKIKYKDNQERFQKIIDEQQYNITAVKENLNALKQIDVNLYNQLNQDYLTKYGKYINTYAAQVKEKIKDKFIEQRKAYLLSLADKINTILNNLSAIPELSTYINQIWQEHPNETEVTITSGDAFNAIIEYIVQRVMEDKNSGAKTITKEIVGIIKENPEVLKQYSDGQAYKALIKKSSRKKTVEEALNGNRMIITKILANSSNAEEILQSFFPHNPKKIQNICEKLKQLQDKAASIKNNNEYNKLFKESKLETELREILPDTDHWKDILNKLAQSSGRWSGILNDSTNNIIIPQPSDVAKSLRNQFSVRIKKSALAELVSHHHNEIRKVIFNEMPASINMKDDVYCAFRVASGFSKELEQESPELRKVLDQLDSALKDHLKKYVEEYANKNSKNARERGATDVARARDLYIKDMTALYNDYEKIIEQNPEIKELLDQYIKSSDTFLNSISVKDYTLYNDTWGYHAGTLGSTIVGDMHHKAIENIQTMYETGGISIMDVNTLEVALLNCSPAAVGGPGLKPSLESYLLGGAALMVFDEGFGNAEKFLDDMEPRIEKLLPKNLNLYFLNSVYVPASYIIENIYSNLKSFYSQELMYVFDSFPKRNRVIITNNVMPPTSMPPGDIEEQFTTIAEEALANIDIQFVFMAGMLDIFTNLSKSFNIK